MSPAGDTSGGPDKDSGPDRADTPSRPKGAARSGRAESAETPETKPGAPKAAKTPAKAAAGSGSKAPGTSKPGSPPPGGSSGTNGGNGPGDNGPGDNGSGGKGAPPDKPQSGDSSSGGSGSVNWGRLALHGAAGAAGGLIVVLIFLLTDVPGGLQSRMNALQPRVESTGAAKGGPQQVAELRRRVEALAELSGSAPLVRQVSEIGGTVGRLQEIVEGLKEGAAGDTLAVAARREEMRADLKQLGEELIRLDTKIARVAGDVRRTEARLADRLASLEAVTPEDLPARLDRTAEKKTVESLLNRVARLERDEMTRDVRRAALAVALSNLTRAVQTSQPFVNELKAIEALEPGNELVSALEPYAGKGVPSLPTLTGRFGKVADDVVAAWRKAHGKGFFAGLWDSIKGLFRVRPVGEAEGGQAPAVVARAEQRLADGDLYLAVQEMAKLGEAENEAAAEWLGAAKSRLRLNDLSAELNREVLEEIAVAAAARKEREESFVQPAEEEQEAAPETGTDGAEQEDAPETENEADAAASER